MGALAAAELCRRLGTHVVMGGVTWERLPIDPRPGPRSARRDRRRRRARAGSAAGRRPTRARRTARVFAESRMAGLLGEQTVLVDSGPRPGPHRREPRAGRCPRWASTCSCSWTWAATCSGRGSEPGLASPLCDAVMLAAAALLQRARRAPCWEPIFGPGCDGELTQEELLGRLALLAARGRALRDRGPHACRRRRAASARPSGSRPRPARRPCAAPGASSARRRSAAGAGRCTCPRSARRPCTSTRRVRWRAPRRWRAR